MMTAQSSMTSTWSGGAGVRCVSMPEGPRANANPKTLENDANESEDVEQSFVSIKMLKEKNEEELEIG